MAALVRWIGLAVLVATIGPGGPAVAADAEAGALPNPENFFARLAERYRRLSYYEDTVVVAETVERAEDRPHEVSSRFHCRIDNGRLSLETPGTQAAAGPGLGGAMASSPAMESLVLRYNLWKAPHLALHFLDEPLRDFRAGVPAGFEVSDATTVADGERTLVRLKLTGLGAEVDDRATFQLWVDPDSMLIERVEGTQQLPDGARLHVTLAIEVTRADGA
jgi:hypothetical protein